MKRRLIFVALACLMLAAIAWVLLQNMRGPVLAAYQVRAQPLVQTVVASGRVVAVSRAQVGSPVTGVVVKRLVQEGDVVQPGDAVVQGARLDELVAQLEVVTSHLPQSRGRSRTTLLGPAREQVP